MNNREHDVCIEAAIESLGKNARRVRLEDIDTLVDSLQVLTHYFMGTTCIVAVAVLPNGFVVSHTHSACISPENFDPEIGERIATDKVLAEARNKLWELEGYRLKHELS